MSFRQYDRLSQRQLSFLFLVYRRICGGQQISGERVRELSDWKARRQLPAVFSTTSRAVHTGLKTVDNHHVLVPAADMVDDDVVITEESNTGGNGDTE